MKKNDSCSLLDAFVPSGRRRLDIAGMDDSRVVPNNEQCSRSQPLDFVNTSEIKGAQNATYTIVFVS
ncbi:hypothetical protein WN51_05657 [Melipona quadrifasciata]|uniref:Uncharacterized protein n=1 Tax=Melipona quadrifasciata TaxID=166423 RepID=A0A0N0U3S9_9HYME|nr:hypothetical protein WN51_05657 [Melipona quadrifasciata]